MTDNDNERSSRQRSDDVEPEAGRSKRSPFSSLVRSFSLSKKTTTTTTTDMPLAPAGTSDETGGSIFDNIDAFFRRGSPVTPGMLVRRFS